MSAAYRVELEPRAREQLGQLPESLWKHVVRQLAILARSPVALSRPAGPLHPAGQLFEVQVTYDESDVYVDVVFRYGQDEMTLYISDVLLDTG